MVSLVDILGEALEQVKSYIRADMKTSGHMSGFVFLQSASLDLQHGLETLCVLFEMEQVGEV